MADQVVQLVITGDSKDAEKSVSSLSAGTVAMGNLISGVVTKAFEMVGQAIGFATDQMKEAISAASAQERSELALVNAMKQAGTFTRESFNRNMELASSLQQLSVFQDEDIINVQKQLSVYGVQGKQLEELTKATLDFASAKGIDLATAGNIIAKTVGTENNALSRYGVEVEGAAGSTERITNAVKNLGTLFGGSAQADTKSFGGAIENIKNQLGEASEGVGNAIVQNQAMGVVFDYVRKAIADLNAWIIKHKQDIMIFVNTALMFAIDGFILLIGTIKWVVQILGMAGIGFTMLGSTVLKVISFIIGLFGELVGGITNLLSKIPLIGDKFKDIGNVITGAIDFSNEKVKSLAEGFDQTGETIGSATITIVEGMTKLQDGATGFRNAIEAAGTGAVATLDKIDVKQTEITSNMIRKQKEVMAQLTAIWKTGSDVIVKVSDVASDQMVKNQASMGMALEAGFKQTLGAMLNAEIDRAVASLSITAATEIGKAGIMGPLSFGISLLAIGGIAAAATLAKAAVKAVAGFSQGGIMGDKGNRIPLPSGENLARVHNGEVIGTPTKLAASGIGGINVAFNNYGAISSDVDIQSIGKMIANDIKNELRGEL